MTAPTDAERDRCGYPAGQEHPHVEQCPRAEREQVLAQVEALADEMQAIADGSASFAAAREGLSDASALADHSAAMTRWAGRLRALVASVRDGAER